MRDFEANLPPAAAGGMFSPNAAAGFDGDVAVADGSYRAEGSDWLFEFRGKRLVRAIRKEHWPTLVRDHARPADAGANG